MGLQTDPRVVARLAQDREEENWRFRSFLKSVDLDAGELDAVVHRVSRDVSSRIDCCACANCCREVLPTLDATDVTRLASGLNLSERETVERFLVPGEEVGTLTFNTRPCPLLSDGRCTVYEARPDECRSYPHLQKEGFAFRLIQAVQNCSVCPIVFNVFERLKDELRHEDPFDEDEEDHGLNEGLCKACGMPGRLDCVGLCAGCSAMLDRDMIRQRAWEYSNSAFGVAPEKREDLRKAVISQYGKALELIAGEPEPRRKRRK